MSGTIFVIIMFVVFLVMVYKPNDNNNNSVALEKAKKLLKEGFEKEKKREDFTAPGWTLTRPSEWWFPEKYDTASWLTPYYPDQLSQPQCLSYNRGPPQPLNFYSTAYRFWRY